MAIIGKLTIHWLKNFQLEMALFPTSRVAKVKKRQGYLNYYLTYLFIR